MLKVCTVIWRSLHNLGKNTHDHGNFRATHRTSPFHNRHTHSDCVIERIPLWCTKLTKRILQGGGQVAHGLRTVIGCCKDGRRRRRRWTDLSRDLSNEQNATRTMTLSRNQSKSAENLRCQRNFLMYFQLTRSVLGYLIVKITLSSTLYLFARLLT